METVALTWRPQNLLTIGLMVVVLGILWTVTGQVWAHIHAANKGK
jgi:hypothetical protein